MNIAGNMYRVQETHTQQNYKLQPIIFDAVPIMRNHLSSVAAVVEMGILSISHPDKIVLFALDTIKEVITNVFACFDENRETWMQQINRSEIFVDYSTVAMSMPGLQLTLKDPFPFDLMRASLVTICAAIFNEMEYFVNTLIPSHIQKHQIASIQVRKVTSYGIECMISYL